MATPAVGDLVAPAVMISACGVLMIAASTRHASVISQLHGLHRERVDLVSRLAHQRREPNHAETVRLEGLELLSHSMLRRARALRLGLLGITACVIAMICTTVALAVSPVDGGGAPAVGLFFVGVACLLAAMLAHVYEIAASLQQVELEHDRVSRLDPSAAGSDHHDSA